jgi:hypothetical protein
VGLRLRSIVASRTSPQLCAATGTNDHLLRVVAPQIGSLEQFIDAPKRGRQFRYLLCAVLPQTLGTDHGAGCAIVVARATFRQQSKVCFRGPCASERGEWLFYLGEDPLTCRERLGRRVGEVEPTEVLHADLAERATEQIFVIGLPKSRQYRKSGVAT